MRTAIPIVLAVVVLGAGTAAFAAEEPFRPRTRVAIRGERWCINGELTNRGSLAEGLIMIVRMVNAGFEDRNGPERDPDVTTDRFLAHLTDYAGRGINAFTLNLQGGMPGYEGALNSAFERDGSLRAAYLARVRRVIEACDPAKGPGNRVLQAGRGNERTARVRAVSRSELPANGRFKMLARTPGPAPVSRSRQVTCRLGERSSTCGSDCASAGPQAAKRLRSWRRDLHPRPSRPMPESDKEIICFRMLASATQQRVDYHHLSASPSNGIVRPRIRFRFSVSREVLEEQNRASTSGSNLGRRPQTEVGTWVRRVRRTEVG